MALKNNFISHFKYNIEELKLTVKNSVITLQKLKIQFKNKVQVRLFLYIVIIPIYYMPWNFEANSSNSERQKNFDQKEKSMA